MGTHNYCVVMIPRNEETWLKWHECINYRVFIFTDNDGD